MSQRPLCVVTGGPLPPTFPRSAFEGQVEFRLAQTDAELRSLVREANVLYSHQIPDTIPTETPDLHWIQLPSAGADHIRPLPVWNSEIVLTSSKGIHTVPMAEHTFALVLSLTRQIPSFVRFQDQHEWIHSLRSHGLRMGELRGKTMGIVGWGKIGDGIAYLARAFGMRVIGTRWSVIVPREVRSDVSAYADPPWLEPVTAPPDIVYPAAQLHEVLAQSNVVVMILPLTEETRDRFGEPEFRAMSKGSIFINVGRGSVVDQDALVAALSSGHLGAAGLDVFDQEPLPRTSPLWSMPNVTITPHVGGLSDHTSERAARLFAVNLTRYLEGQPLLNLVDRNRGY